MVSIRNRMGPRVFVRKPHDLTAVDLQSPFRHFARLLRIHPRLVLAVLAAGLAAGTPRGVFGQVDGPTYYVYVACESDDEVDLVTFANGRAEVAARIPVGVYPTEIEGPHGLTASPDDKYWFVTMAHGNPYGSLYKYETGSDRLVGSVELGLFPATMEISPATGLLYAANFNLHGDMTPGTISVVDPGSMTELGTIATGIMPHGSRLTTDGLRHYSVSMMDGLLHEIDAVSLVRTRVLDLGTAVEHHGDPGEAGHETHGGGGVKPTWAVPSPSGDYVYVALNGADRIVEVDVASWAVRRTFHTGRGPYNLGVTSDGEKLVASYKGEGATGIWNLKDGAEVARLPNTRGITHGVAISDDNRFAFVSVEGVGLEPGSVDVIDLTTLSLAAHVDVGQQAGGVYFWKQSID